MAETLDHLDYIYQGDAYTILHSRFPPNSVDCVVTSPPYFNLRNYAIEGQMGSEASIYDYVGNLCRVMAELKRVLKPTGTVWLNLGDSYGTAYGAPHKGKRKTARMGHWEKEHMPYSFGKPAVKGYHKSLMGVPFRVLVVLLERGWKLRNTVIWHKPNAMPDSAKDRFTNDFDYLFFLVKSNKYYFEQQFEPAVGVLPTFDEYYSRKRAFHNHDNDLVTGQSKSKAGTPTPYGRNKRSVWRINTKAYKGAHFATFPEELIETPIKAGCPPEGIVLDPFLGSGTTAAVAKRLGRHYLGIELNAEYIELAKMRLNYDS